MKRNMRAQIEAAAHKVASKAGNRQAAIDIDASVEASLKTSPEWRDFMQKHDNSFGPRFGNQKEIVRRQINK